MRFLARNSPRFACDFARWRERSNLGGPLGDVKRVDDADVVISQHFDTLCQAHYLTRVGPVQAAASPRASTPPLNTFQTILFVAPVLLFSVIAHEYAHGYAALRQGDPTAYQLGRLTWNPVKHIDPFMTLLLPAVLLIATHGQMVLGGAKPVPVNPRNYRNFKRGDIIVSLAGVTANLALAIGCALAIVLLGLIGRLITPAQTTVAILQVMLSYGIWLNLILIAFNLIPIPPLDGSHVMKYLLPVSWAVRYEALSRYGIIVLVVLLYFGGPLLMAWMQPAVHATDLLMQAVNPFVMTKAQQWAP